MIDWVSFSVPYDGSPVQHEYWKRDHESDMLLPAYTRAVAVEGSWSSAMQVQTKEGRLYVSVNPARWLTGQNVVGTDDLPRLVEVLVSELFDRLGWAPGGTLDVALKAREVKLTRVDCTYHYNVGSDDEVAAFIRALEHSCTARYRGRGHYDDGMCSIGWGFGASREGKRSASRRSTFKFYNKYRELRRHKLECDERWHDELRALAYGVVRAEACYRGIELERLEKNYLHQWQASTALQLHSKWLGNLDMTAQMEKQPAALVEIPKHLLRTYLLWKNGEDCREHMHRATFYRHRKELMAHDIDIAHVKPPEAPATVVRFSQVLVATPVNEAEGESLFWRLAA